MKYYKNPVDNTLYAYESDGSQDEYILPGLVAITEAEAEVIRQPQPLVLTVDQIKLQRQYAYQTESDPLFFKAQRGEVQVSEWTAKVDEIRTRFPLPV